MDLLNDVKKRAGAQIDSQKNKATDTLGVIAKAVRGTTTQLRDDQHNGLAEYVESAANQLERVSTSLREKDMPALMADARELARRHPALFIGGSFAVGLLAARFLKSSPRDNGAAPRDNYSTGRTSSHEALLASRTTGER